METSLRPTNKKDIADSSKIKLSRHKLKQLRNENKRHNKVIQESRSKAASTEHIIQTDKTKRYRRPESKGRNIARNNLKQKQESTKIANASNVNVIKPRSFDWNSKKKHLMESKIGKRFFNKKGALLMAGLAAGATALSAIGSKHGVMPLTNGPIAGGFEARSSYIPDSYKRGYHDIKEALTDFGSRVHLDKTIKSLVKPYNSTRHNVRQTVQSVCDDNVALSMHKNAINHTRY